MTNAERLRAALGRSPASVLVNKQEALRGLASGKYFLLSRLRMESILKELEEPNDDHRSVHGTTVDDA